MILAIPSSEQPFLGISKTYDSVLAGNYFLGSTFPYHQCTGVKTLLVVLALEVPAPQLVNFPIVEPEEADDNEVEAPSDNDLRPNCGRIHSKRSDADDPAGLLWAFIILES